MSLGAFLSSAAGAFTVLASWYLIQWAWRRTRPQPRSDQAICYNCRVVGGVNLRLEADEAADHLRAHVAMFPGEDVRIAARWARQGTP